MTITRLSAPSIYGSRRISPLYQVLNTGLTNTVLLIGHADAEQMEAPYQVLDMRATLQFLGNDYESPLVRGLLEAYNSGARDIWVYAAAPMEEYESNIAQRLTANAEWGGLNFYEKYYERLTTAYSILMVYDFAEMVVPIEAPFYDSGDSDFLTQLADFCYGNFTTTGAVSIGIMGTRIPDWTRPDDRITNYNTTTINEMVVDTRINLLGAKGKFIAVIVGEGVFMPEQGASVYNRSLEVVMASLLAVTPLDRAISGLLLPGVVTSTSSNLKPDQIETLAQAKLNPIVKTANGRRGFSYQVKLVTDNTCGEDESDYWSLTQMRVVGAIANKIRAIGLAYIGESYDEFKKYTYEFLKDLESNGYIAQASAIIERSEDDPYKADVQVSVKPIIGIKTITFAVEVGPGV